MKKLYLKLKSQGIHSFEFDMVWDDDTFEFVDFENNNIFDNLNIALADTGENRLLISGINNNERLISGEFELCNIEFKFNDDIEKEVEFLIENKSAQDFEGNEVSFLIDNKKYEPGYNSIISFVWK